jgi:hypothetical protein
MKPHSCLACLPLSNRDIMCSGWDPEFMTADAPQWDEDRPLLLGEIQTRFAQQPVYNSNYGAWLLGLAVCLEFPNPDKLRSHMFCCCPCLRFPWATLNWESFHTKLGNYPPASSIDWIGCHSNRPGRSCIWKLPVPGDVHQLSHHSKDFSDSWTE